MSRGLAKCILDKRELFCFSGIAHRARANSGRRRQEFLFYLHTSDMLSQLLQSILLTSGVSIGIVTAIAAPASIKVDFEGNGGHAGAVLMPARFA